MTEALSTAHLARLCARRPWLTIGAWLLLVVISLLVVGALLGDALTTDDGFTNNHDSKAAEMLIAERLDIAEPVSDIVLVRSATLTVDDPQFEQAITGLATELREFGEVSTFYSTGDPALVSEDRDTTIINLRLTSDDEAFVDGFVVATTTLDGQNGFETAVTGISIVDRDFTTVAEEDLQKGEGIGILVAMIVLVLVFGAVVASLIPIVLAIISIVIALGLTALIGQAFELSFFVVNMLVMMGLAVGIDYALFIVSRYREERARGVESVEAIGIAGSTASRAVFFSGITVVLALLGMLLVPTTIFRSLAIGAIVVVLVSVVAALTLLPAVLSVLGDRIEKLRLPFRRKLTVDSWNEGVWARIVRNVVRRPVLSLVAGVAILLAAAVPLKDINTGFAGVDTLPDEFVSKQGFVLLDEEFSFAQTEPVQIVVDGDLASSATAIGDLQAVLAEDGRFGASEVVTSPGDDLALLDVPILGGASSDEAVEAVRDLRDIYVPASFPPDTANVVVGGATAENATSLTSQASTCQSSSRLFLASASSCWPSPFDPSSFRSSR